MTDALRRSITASAVGVLVIAAWYAPAAVTAQYPTLDAFLAEPLHTVRGRLVGAMVDDSDPRLGVELAMPESVDAGSFEQPRQEFYRHPVLLPHIRIGWTYARTIDDELHHSERNEYTPAPREVRGEGWVALTEWPYGAPDVQVVVRLTSPRGALHCIGSGGSEVTDTNADRVRDWLLARCRSVHFVPLP
jgi:hypothetical protein